MVANIVTENRKRFKSLFIKTVVILVLIGGMIWLWEDVLKDRVIPKRWGAIQQGLLYRSGRLSATLVKSTLEKHKIAVIIDLSGEKAGDKDQEAEKAAAAELGIELLRFPLRGNGTGDIEHYAQAIAAMVRYSKEQKPVLVHCASGTQRTGGVTASYRMLVENKPALFAYEELKRYDWDPDKNQELLLYINQHMAELARRLQEMGVIKAIPNPLPQLPIRN